AYTLQGWLKGVNSTSVGDGTYDMGEDGKVGGMNAMVARDAYSFGLHYFQNDIDNRRDYKAISASKTPFANPGISGAAPYAELFNGNIGAMSVNIPKIGDALLNVYKYDQLNRLTKTYVYKGLGATNAWSKASLTNNAYREQITYDANGNIKTYKRNGDPTRSNTNGTGMDNMTYTYKANKNQLDKVVDAAADASVANYPNYNDIKQGQANGNYTYDEIGNLKTDVKGDIVAIIWNAYGKVTNITKTSGDQIFYTYDAFGNRISSTFNNRVTWYVRDANGNIMSSYMATADINAGQLSQTELYIYGSNRIGSLNLKTNVQTPVNASGILNFERTRKQYELANHLGNVLVTVSDKKIQNSANQNSIDYYYADVVNANDYYTGGMPLPGRNYTNSTNYLHGFNSHEKSDDVSGVGNHTSALFGEYDTRLVRRWNLDPRPNVSASPYSMFSNNPVWFSDIAMDTARNGGNGSLGQNFKFENENNELTDKEFKGMQDRFYANLDQQVNNGGHTYRGDKVSLNSKDALASTITVTFGRKGISNGDIMNNSMYISLEDMDRSANVSTHEWLHTAGLMDRYFELYGRKSGDEATQFVESQRSQETVPMKVLPPGHDDDHTSQNMMASAGSQITKMQWDLVFNLQTTGITEESLGTLGKVSFVYTYSTTNPRSSNNRFRKLSNMIAGLKANSHRMAFSSTSGYALMRGTLLTVPNGTYYDVMPPNLNTYIIHNRTGNVLGYNFTLELGWEKKQVNDTIQR
ncbi:MAG: hypothetical protein EOO89_13650, partial [Pedobacter sp.]